jgi:hypothetical protein
VRLPPLLLRRIHKWIGLILGLQFLLWAISGTAMALLDMEEVAGGPAAAPAASSLAPSRAWPEVRRALGGRPVTAMAVRPLLNGHVLEIGTPAGVRLFDSVTGRAVKVDAHLARRIAEASHGGRSTVRSVAPLDELTLAVREHQLPIWRVDFADERHSSFYVSGTTGELLERRNDSWRLWDFFWMLHNMDYANRASFNHPLIVAVTFGILWLTITGAWLLFKTCWRAERRLLRRL